MDNTTLRAVLAEILESNDAKHHVVLALLARRHNYVISLSQLKRVLNKFGLSRKYKATPNSSELIDDIGAVQRGHADQIGGLLMLNYLRHRNSRWRVQQENVRSTLRLINPENVEIRRRRHLHPRIYHSLGPDDTWHIDQYDKLKKYGFPIHGCIDGYSRKILWMKAVPSNNNPIVVADLYLRCVAEQGGCPMTTRTDHGNENQIMAGIQRSFRFYQTQQNDSEAMRSHRWGSSPSNSRIESNWSRFRRLGGVYWMESFQMLELEGFLNNNDTAVINIVRRLVGPILDLWLEDHVYIWNRHYIRPSKSWTSVPGRPNLLYELPFTPAIHCLQIVSPAMFQLAEERVFQNNAQLPLWMTANEAATADSAILNGCNRSGVNRQDVCLDNWMEVFRDTMILVQHPALLQNNNA